ncbi:MULTISPECIES: hypothetical protein [Okeania]|uniref:Uncharacterized protein n=1 Tax=Okeania hirsuta TaxID=1458930 RepID=A0A3N6PHI8_9CYAN|nr:MULTISPECIES: hypothetical protein [Okeania]NEP04231.1 hypothetical protein [Okeania sp. SIO4D6]NEP43255.1 hypothetical protein [Okeania sp. SIO2H7]NET14241.1 hypothetical protein [Okeania sp. SIO1H6]NEP75241.1 hypothetical protein [Okeania sp. SIO2G5]NEP94794.1 hypothetical protein [Okeania sp. SIO2F5]
MEGCTVTDLKIDSKKNCYVLDAEAMRQIQEETAVSTKLEPGIYVIRIRSGLFGYRNDENNVGEPMVMLWIYGGKFINKKTNLEVEATWSTLNGDDDTLTLEVVQTTNLCAFFFDSYIDDNQGELTISIVKM